MYDDTAPNPEQHSDDTSIPAGAEEAVAEGLTGDDSIPLAERIQGSEDPNRTDNHLTRTGAYTFDQEHGHLHASPEAAGNPAGVARGDCDTPAAPDDEAACDLEVTAQVDNYVAEETKPGMGIPGFESEESGGA